MDVPHNDTDGINFLSTVQTRIPIHTSSGNKLIIAFTLIMNAGQRMKVFPPTSIRLLNSDYMDFGLSRDKTGQTNNNKFNLLYLTGLLLFYHDSYRGGLNLII